MKYILNKAGVFCGMFLLVALGFVVIPGQINAQVTCQQNGECCQGNSNNQCFCRGTSVQCNPNDYPGPCGTPSKCECGAAQCTSGPVPAECKYENGVCGTKCNSGYLVLKGCGASSGGPSPSPGSSPPPGGGGAGGCGAPCTDVSQCNIVGAVNPACSSGVCWDAAVCGGGGGGNPTPPPCTDAPCGDGTCQSGAQFCGGGETCSSCAQDCCAGWVEGTVFDNDLAQYSCTDKDTYPVGGAQVRVRAVDATDKDGCDVSDNENSNSSGFYKTLLCTGTYTATVVKDPYVADPEFFCGDSGTSVFSIRRSRTTKQDLGISKVAPPWLQVQGSGNVYAEGLVDNRVARDCNPPTCTPYFMVDTSGDPGILMYNGASAILTSNALKTSEDVVSRKGWLIKGDYKAKQYGYQFYYNQLRFSTQSVADFSGGEIGKPTGTPKSGTAFLSRGDTILGGSNWSVGATEKIVLLVDGDVTVKNKISVAKGGFLMVLSSGDIAVDPLLNSEDSTVAISGVFVADGVFSTGVVDTRLILEGTYVGWGGVDLQRDFGLYWQPGDGLTQASRNYKEPVEVIRYRPDFVANAPNYLVRPRITWEEVAP